MAPALAHPGLLATGLGLVLVPILIHLFFRRRHRVVRWAAMNFLLAALRKQKRRIEVENLLLLLLRCLAVALFALAVARPAVEAAALNPFAGRARSLVLVLDTSASMGAKVTSRSSLDRAREQAFRLLVELPDSSAVTVVATRDDLAGGIPNVLLESATPARARERVDKHLHLSYGAADLAETFRLVRSRLDKLEGEKAVLFLTDLQARDWLNADGGRREDLHRALRSLGGDGIAPPVSVFDVGLPEISNVSLTEFTVDAGREAFADTPLGLTATLVNFGALEATGTLSLFLQRSQEGGWEKRESRRVVLRPSLGLGEPIRSAQDFYVTLPKGSEGPTRLRTQFDVDSGPSDRLDLDNERFLALRVRPPVRFLPVTTFSRALGLLRDTDVSPIIDFLEPIRPESLGAQDLSRVDVLLWADADAHGLDEAWSKSIEDFVRRGGGLLAYLGDGAQPEIINRFFFRERGLGLFPMLLDEGSAPSVPEGGTPWVIDTAACASHPLFAEVGDEWTGRTEILRFRVVREAPPASIVARYDTPDGDPAVLEHRLGRGRVLVVTTTPDERWFRINGSLLPAILFFNAAHYLVAEDPSHANVTVGMPLRIPLAPGSRRIHIEPPEAAGGATEEEVKSTDQPFLVPGTAYPGFYRITVKGMNPGSSLPVEEVHVACANLDASEGDLRRVPPAEIDRLFRDTSLRLATDSETVVPERGQTGGAEVSRSLLGGVAVLLLVELLLAWRFGARRRAVEA